MKLVVTIFDDDGGTNPTWVEIKNIPERPIDKSDLWDSWTSRLKIAAARAAALAYEKRLALLESAQ